MRILCQCSGFLPSAIGGAEVLLHHLVTALRRRGHEILVMAPCGPGDAPGARTVDGLDLVRLDVDSAMASRNPAALRSVHGAVAGYVARFRPDILHLNDAWLGSFFFLRGGATGRLPRVLTLHSAIRPPGSDGLQARLAADADRIVTVSDAHCAAARAAMPAEAARISAIVNALPLPLPPVRRAPSAAGIAAPMLLCLGRLVADKGIDLAIGALARLVAGGSPARLTIAGDGPERSRLEDLARSLGIAASVDFIGWIMPDRVPALLDGATLVLVPSRWPEPFGLVALQAAQRGRPVIASAMGGLPEIVEHGHTGLLVAPDDAGALADAIGSVLGDPPALQRLGDNARRRAAESFDFGAFVGAYERVYADARDAPAGGRRPAETGV